MDETNQEDREDVVADGDGENAAPNAAVPAPVEIPTAAALRRNGKDRGASEHARRMRSLEMAWSRGRSHREGRPAILRAEQSALANALVDRKDLAVDRALALRHAPFLAYRYLNPYEATEEFNALYEAEWRRALYKFHGIHMQGPSPTLARRSDREFTALWRARQIADELGMPYGVAIGSSIESMVQESGKKRLPRPNQLWGRVEIDRAIALWDHPGERFHAYDQFLLRNLPDRFWLPSQNGDPVQLSAVDDYVWYVNNSLVRVGTLASLIGTVLTEAQARELFPQYLVDDALVRVATRDAPDLPPAVQKPYFPSCYGFAYDERASACIQCPVANLCAGATGMALELVKERYGSADPRRDKVREADRLRQQAYRRRKREARKPK